jgi:hypothetical protein
MVSLFSMYPSIYVAFFDIAMLHLWRKVGLLFNYYATRSRVLTAAEPAKCIPNLIILV